MKQLFNSISILSIVVFSMIFSTLFISCISMKKTIQKKDMALVHGFVAEGFEEVKTEFIRNLTTRRDIGAACCIYYKGEKVVDLWGGVKNKKTKEPWEENTIVKVFSTTKGMALLVLAKMHSDGLLDYNEKVATYWPEFAKNGKENITIEQLLTHKAGLVLLERNVKVSELHDFKTISLLLENATPLWEPGKKSGYHSATIGLYIQQLVMRIDKKGRTVGQYFAEEIAQVLEADFFIGIPENIDVNRIASLKELVPPLALFQLKKVPKGMLSQLLNPSSLMMKSFMLIKIDIKDPIEELRFEEAAGGGAGNARALAKVYGDLAIGSANLKMSKETLDIISTRTESPTEGNFDQVMKIKLVSEKAKWSRGGFCKPNIDFDYGSDSAFGFYGTGGSFAFADPKYQVGYAYTMNKMDFYTQNDPREIALREAMYRCIEKLNK